MIKTILSQFGVDKYEHFALAGLAAALLKCVIRVWLPLWAAMLIASVVVLACCVGKELLYDKKEGKGTPEWADMWAGALGVLVGIA